MPQQQIIEQKGKNFVQDESSRFSFDCSLKYYYNALEPQVHEYRLHPAIHPQTELSAHVGGLGAVLAWLGLAMVT